MTDKDDKCDNGAGGPIEHTVSLEDIARALDLHKANYLAAMQRAARHPEDRTDAINQALEASIGMTRATRMADLFIERVHGKSGLPPDPSAEGEEAARKWAVETMATITGRLLFRMFGPEFYPTRALHADLRRWLNGSAGLVYQPIGWRNPASPDAVKLDDRVVAVLTIKMAAAASGKPEKAFIEGLPAPHPSYRLFRKWQAPVPARDKKWSVYVGKRAKTRTSGEVLLPDREIARANPTQLAVLGIVMEGSLSRLLASILEAGEFRGTSSKNYR